MWGGGGLVWVRVEYLSHCSKLQHSAPVASTPLTGFTFSRCQSAKFGVCSLINRMWESATRSPRVPDHQVLHINGAMQSPRFCSWSVRAPCAVPLEWVGLSGKMGLGARLRRGPRSTSLRQGPSAHCASKRLQQRQVHRANLHLFGMRALPHGVHVEARIHHVALVLFVLNAHHLSQNGIINTATHPPSHTHHHHPPRRRPRQSQCQYQPTNPPGARGNAVPTGDVWGPGEANHKGRVGLSVGTPGFTRLVCAVVPRHWLSGGGGSMKFHG